MPLGHTEDYFKLDFVAKIEFAKTPTLTLDAESRDLQMNHKRGVKCFEASRPSSRQLGWHMDVMA